jgi:hypothetical protein
VPSVPIAGDVDVPPPVKLNVHSSFPLWVIAYTFPSWPQIKIVPSESIAGDDRKP